MREMQFFLGAITAGCSILASTALAMETGEPGIVSAVSDQLDANTSVSDTTKQLTQETLPADLGTRKTGTDWPTFLGPSGGNKSTETGIVTDWPKSGPKLLWQMPLDTSYGMPTISRGRLFQFVRTGDKARLLCTNSESGKHQWDFEYDTAYQDMYGYNNGPRCSPVVDGDRVYIYGAEGMLHCVRAVDGKLMWKLDTVEQFGVVQNFFGVGSTPIIENDLLIVQVGGSPPDSPDVITGRVRGNGTGAVALDKFTGKVRYKLSDELASYSSPALATIANRRWCFLFARGGLLGFEPHSGKLDFHYPWRAKTIESVNASSPVVVEDMVFISETYGVGSSLLKVRPGGYDVVWADNPRKRDKSIMTHWNTAIHHEGYLYGSSGRHSREAELRCIELSTGKVMWSEPGLYRSSLLYVDGHFVCLSEDGSVYLLRATPEKFDLVAKVVPTDAAGRPLLKYPCWAAPILSHGLLYLRGKDRLLCMELIPN